MNVLALASVCILAGFSLSPGGECLPSPRADSRYAFDFAIDQELEGYFSKGHRRLKRAAGRGSALDTSVCDTVTSVPSDIRTGFPLDDFYQKYTHAYGIPIVSSSNVQDGALKRACYTVRFLMADRKDVRDAMYDFYGRVGVIAQSEETTDIPEHSHLPDSTNTRARGLGGIQSIPITTDGEENVACVGFPNDRWFEEDVLVHEFAHAIHLISLKAINSSFDDHLLEIYNAAKADNLWQYTYAISDRKEYFAEGVQGYFNVQTCRDFRDNIHNNICTREALKGYDIRLYDLIEAVFPCKNLIVDRCADQSLIANQTMGMNYDMSASGTCVISSGQNPGSTAQAGTAPTQTSDNGTDSTPESGAETAFGCSYWMLTWTLLVSGFFIMI